NLGGGGFSFTPRASFVGTVTFSYQFSTSLGSSNIATVTVVVNPAPSQDFTIASTDVPKSIPDPGQLISTITVPSLGTILDVTATFSITHECEADLVVYVRHPDGTLTNVMNHGLGRCSGVPETFTSTSLTLGNMLGKQTSGVWQLIVTD